MKIDIDGLLDGQYGVDYAKTFGEQLDFSTQLTPLANLLYRQTGATRSVFSLLFDNGSWFHLCNLPDVNLQLSLQMLEEAPKFATSPYWFQLFTQEGYYILDSMPLSEEQKFELYLTQNSALGFYHPMYIVKRAYTPMGIATLMCCFYIDEQQSVENTLLDNIPLLNGYMTHFSERLFSTGSSLPLVRPPNEELLIAKRIYAQLGSERESLSLMLERYSQYHVTNNSQRTALTQRQKDVLAWNKLGKSTSEIAALMGVTPNTIRYHFKQLYKHFDCSSKSALRRQLELES